MARDTNIPRLKALIDANLKRVYDEALEQKLPARFKELLDQLKQREAEE